MVSPKEDAFLTLLDKFLSYALTCWLHFGDVWRITALKISWRISDAYEGEFIYEVGNLSSRDRVWLMLNLQTPMWGSPFSIFMWIGVCLFKWKKNNYNLILRKSSSGLWRSRNRTEMYFCCAENFRFAGWVCPKKNWNFLIFLPNRLDFTHVDFPFTPPKLSKFPNFQN